MALNTPDFIKKVLEHYSVCVNTLKLVLHITVNGESMQKTVGVSYRINQQGIDMLGLGNKIKKMGSEDNKI
jgi:hypothetical protein